MMNSRRAPWIFAAAMSLAGHAAVVAALTPSHEDPQQREAGSGAGSAVDGSVDAIVGMSMPIDQVITPDATESATEIQPEPAPEVQTAALAPELTSASAVPAIETTQVDEVQPAERPTEIAAADPTMIEASDPVPVESTTEVAEPTEAPELTSVEPQIGETHASPIESDLAAVSPTEITHADAAPLAASPVQPAEAEAKAAQSAQPSEVAAVATPEAVEAVAPQSTAIAPADEEPPVKPRDRPDPPKPAKVAKAEKKVVKPNRSAGNSDTNSRKGAAKATTDSTAQDPGIGRSEEVGDGWFDRSNYNGRIYSRLKRMIRYPSDAQRRGIGGTARVSFIIAASGKVSGLRLISSSGDAAIDSAALETVRRAAPFPALPHGSGLRSLAISVPLRFNPRR